MSFNDSAICKIGSQLYPTDQDLLTVGDHLPFIKLLYGQLYQAHVQNNHFKNKTKSNANRCITVKTGICLE